MKNKTWIWVLITTIVIIALFVWGSSTKPTSAGFWQDTSVHCLPSGHQNLVRHIHPTLEIFVDGEKESIPANTGVSAECMAEIHTHDSSGELHLETTDRSRVITMGNFFEVLGESLEREGFEASFTVNGEEIDDLASYEPEDHDAVVVEYTSTTSDQATSTQETEE